MDIPVGKFAHLKSNKTVKSIVFVLFILLLTSCSWLDSTIETTVTWDDGKTVVVDSKDDALVIIKKGDQELTVDNRGSPSLFRLFIESLLIRTSGAGGSNDEDLK